VSPVSLAVVHGWLGGHPVIDAAFLKSENGAENLDDLCGFGDQGRALLD
jgi:hypothetical protein